MRILGRRELAMTTALLSGLLLAVGCGGPDNVGYVSGTVTLDGQPLADALIMFNPASGSPSAGRTDSAGKYTLEYTSDTQGAEIGEHQVTISTYRPASPDTDPPIERSPEKVPAKYNLSTELKATVAKGSNELNFDLKSDSPVIQPEQQRE